MLTAYLCTQGRNKLNTFTFKVMIEVQDSKVTQ